MLKPLLAALESGNDLQREAILNAFDGSFFKGRFYARRPEGMIDVGNDREFGFLYEPPTDVLERTFAAVFDKESRPEVRRQALLLSGFFRLHERSDNATIQSALLASLADPDRGVREAGRKAIGGELSLRGAESDLHRRHQVRDLLRGDTVTVRIVAQALGRNPTLASDPQILADLKGLLARADAAIVLRPVLALPVFSHTEWLVAITRAWPLTANPDDKIALLELLLRGRGIMNTPRPPDEAVALVRTAIADHSATVREHTLKSIAELPGWNASNVSNAILLSALADDTPALRALGVKLAGARAQFWERADARELLARLLIDPSGAVRELALGEVERHRLLVGSPSLAKRVKAVEADPKLKERVRAVLSAQGFETTNLVADVVLSKPRLLGASRRFACDVNPPLYRSSEDWHLRVYCRTRPIRFCESRRPIRKPFKAATRS